MDVYTALNALRKLKVYIDDAYKNVADRSGMVRGPYKSTIEKHYEIYQLSSYVAHWASKLVELEVVEKDGVELEPRDYGGLRSAVQSMGRDISELQNLMRSDAAHTDILDSTVSSSVSAREKAITKSMYHKVLGCGARVDTGYAIVNKAATLIWTWFDRRILTEYKYIEVHNYSQNRFPDIVYAIVILVGYYYEQGILPMFEAEFKAWEESLATDPGSASYRAPISVHRQVESLDPMYANLTATVIWDLLCDKLYREICNSYDAPGVYFREDGVYNKIFDANPDVLNAYDNYKVNPKMLEYLMKNDTLEG